MPLKVNGSYHFTDLSSEDEDVKGCHRSPLSYHCTLHIMYCYYLVYIGLLKFIDVCYVVW